MSGVENLAQSVDEPEEPGAEIIALDFGQREVPPELEIEDRLLGGMLSDDSREFIFRQAGVHNVHPFQIMDAAIESYKYFVTVLEEGHSILTVDRYGQTHSVVHNDSQQPPAV